MGSRSEKELEMIFDISSSEAKGRAEYGRSVFRRDMRL